MNIFVAGLPYDMDDAELREFFEKFGKVNSAKVAMDKDTGKSRGFGFVEMPDDTAAQKAISELNGAVVEGRSISVNVARPREERSNSGGGGNKRSFSGNNNKRW